MNTVEYHIEQLIEQSWQKSLQDLLGSMKVAHEQVADLLRLEDYYLNGHKSKKLASSLGAFGSQTIDLDKLSEMLSQGDERRLMSKERYDRVESICNKLEKIRQTYSKEPPTPQILSFNDKPERILTGVEKHLNNMAGTFRFLRMAKLEANARYRPEQHNAYFETFDWQQLDGYELSHCPPFVVLAENSDDQEKFLLQTMRLLSPGMPLKVMALQSSVPQRYLSRGMTAALQCSLAIEMLPLALRGVYVFQSSVVDPNLHDNIAEGLRSPRPGLFSLFWKEGVVQNGFKVRAENMLSSRTFPYFVYNPDQSRDFVSCFDLSGNPSLDRNWPRIKLQYIADSGETKEVERDFTFADFAVHEEKLTDEFAEFPEEGGKMQPTALAEYLSLALEKRVGRLPFVYGLDQRKRLVRRVPSKRMIEQTMDRMHLWHTLREVAGVENPHVREAERRVRQQLVLEKEESLKELRTQLETKVREREQHAVSGAMKGLALRLTGMLQGSEVALPLADAKALTQKPKSQEQPATLPVSPAAAKLKPAVSQQPWIDSKRCTSCDECISINKKIFAYDDKQKAYIKDAKGGPFKDIVQAAEKCSSRVIHPGTPQDPDEKDLEKWVKRAEKFQ